MFFILLVDAHVHWLATDFAIIEIFYSKLEYAKLEEIKSYGAFALVGKLIWIIEKTIPQYNFQGVLYWQLKIQEVSMIR